MRKIVSALAVAGVLCAAAIVPVAPAHAADRYQIVKATENRVWRLDTETGEIAVCTLDGENLFCTTTSEAVDAPEKSYEDWEAEQAARAQAEEMKRKEKLALIDRFLGFIRSLIHSEMEQGAAQ